MTKNFRLTLFFFILKALRLFPFNSFVEQMSDFTPAKLYEFTGPNCVRGEVNFYTYPKALFNEMERNPRTTSSLIQLCIRFQVAVLHLKLLTSSALS